MNHQPAMLLFLFGLLLAPAVAQSDSEGREPWVNASGVLGGDPATCQSPAQIDFAKVWRVIPEVLQIRRENPGPAARDILTARANARLQAAINSEMHESGYDCVVRSDAISGEPPLDVPDITRAIIARVKRS